MKNTLLFSILFSLFTLHTSPCEANWLMPKPKSITDNGATFDLQRTVRLTDPTASTLLASLFTTDDNASATVTVNLVDDEALGTFDYTLPGFDNEGYKLSVTTDNITIIAASPTGVIRAAQTLAQLVEAADGAFIQGVNITDYPAFKLRGFMHDVGRSFISFDELKNEIDLLSRFKVNVFHWHLTDNQGFRFESKLYPQLNNASSMTRFAGQYYTQQQCTELEAYAAERGVIIIPEIDMPGHSTAFTTAMGYTMSSDQGRAALKQLLGELADAFPLAPYIHMGADEAGTTAAFVNEMSQYIKETLGRRCIVWNPISGVSITASTLPYVDMTEMWSTSGKKISGLPNIDCRYNYVNHFDVFADLVGIYKSNIYYAQQGSSEVAGAITALWNDRKTPTETDIISQNNLYANALATAERGWMGGGKQYIEVGGTTLPNIGKEYDEFADWERRFLHYKDSWLSAEPIPYVKQTNVRWRITEPFPNNGSATAVFPPEEASDDILPSSFTYNGQTYSTGLATGAGIYLRHTWGTTVPAYFSNPQSNTTAYAWTYAYSPKAQTAGALIEFQNYGRSENDKAPDAGNWDRKGSRIWLNGEEIMPPTWTNSGKSIGSEVDLQNENFAAREPVSVQLQEGWNKVFLKLPYVSANGVRLNKWLFTFVLTTPDGRHALDDVVYSPTKTMNFEDEEIPRTLSSDPLPELEGRIISVSSTTAANLTTDQWYVMFDRGANHGYLWENAGTHTLFNTATAPSSSATNNAKYLVRLVDASDGKYYLQTGYGNYFGKIQQSVNVPLTANPTEAITVAKISDNDSHFYLQSADGVVLDANDLSLGDSRATVVGWGTTPPTSLNGNNDWAFYPVEVDDASQISFTSDDVAVCQGHQTAGQGNTKQALLRAKVTATTACTPTRFDITLTGAEQMSRVAVYATDIDQLHAPDASPRLLGAATPVEGELSIPVNGCTLTDGQQLYFWITADVKTDAAELSTIDAALCAITSDNLQGGSTCDLQDKGNPAGVMRIYKRQQFLWTGSQSKAKYYRIPTIMRTDDGGIVALCDDRYDNTQDLGKVASGAAGKHKIDVVMRKSLDDGATWGNPQVVAAGDGNSAAACGYGDPAIVRTLSGKLICLMAAGSTSFPNGMLHMGYSYSTDNGTTWSAPTDIYSAINKSGLTITSAFTSAGKGICFSNGRIAFALNAKVDGVCNEYILYSDDEGATWTIAPNMACPSADESKLEIMNDNSLLLSVRQGGWNSQANRAYSRTTGNAAGSGIKIWTEKGYWTDLNANGCNADILYYSRETEGNGVRDLMLHTAVKTFQTYRKDLRLYMSFDQGQTWQEAFQLQPGYSAYSSMQKLDNGDLAIIFEDGSLGNQDKMDCYAMTYLVISRETLEARADEVWQTKQETAGMTKIVYENSKETEMGKWDNDNTSGRNVWTSVTPANPIAGLTLTKSAGTFDRYTGWNGFYNLAYKVGAANRDEVLTLTAPDGYFIKSYSFQVQEWSSGAAANHFTLKTEDGTTITPAYGGSDGYLPFGASDINAKSTYFTVRSTDTSRYIAIINFVVILTSDDPDGIEDREQRVENTSQISNLKSQSYYDLTGQPVSTPTHPGIYIKGHKKILVR